MVYIKKDEQNPSKIYNYLSQIEKHTTQQKTKTICTMSGKKQSIHFFLEVKVTVLKSN